MSKSNWELWGIIIAIVEFNINYFIYTRTGSFSNVLMVIIVSLISFYQIFILELKLLKKIKKKLTKRLKGIKSWKI